MQLASHRPCPQTRQHCSQCRAPAARQLVLLLAPQPLSGANRHRACRHSPQPTAALASDSGAGDERVQENLVDIIKVQIGQQHVKSYFEDESDRLRRTADEADINQSADEVEAQLLAQRRENEEDAAAFRQWQRQMAVDRSRGHFFKSLYQAEIDEEEDETGRPVRRKALKEQALVPEAPPSRAQLFTCAFLAGVLITAVAADISTASPAWGTDALYLVMGLGLAAAAWGSRSAL